MADPYTREELEAAREAGQATIARLTREAIAREMDLRLAESDARLAEQGRDDFAADITELREERARAAESMEKKQKRIDILENAAATSKKLLAGKTARLNAIHGVLSNSPDIAEAIAIVERQGPPETECEDCHATLPVDRWCEHCGCKNPKVEERCPSRTEPGTAAACNGGRG